MALTNAYCTVEELREQFDDDGLLLPEAIAERAIAAVSRSIDRYCGRRFWRDPAPVVRTFAPNCPTWVRVADISTTTGLVVRSGITGALGSALTLGTDFRLEPRNADADGGAYSWYRIVLLGGNTFGTSTDYEVEVTARWGWSSVPDDVVQACVIRSAQIFKRRESVSGVAGFGEFGAVRISSKQDPDVAELLAPFKPVMVA